MKSKILASGSPRRSRFNRCRYTGKTTFPLQSLSICDTLAICFRYIDAMSTIQITLSEPLQRFVVKQVVELGLDQPDQYFEQLLEGERRRKRDEYYYQKCLEGIASGPTIPVTAGFWDDIADEVEQELYGIRSKVAQ